MKQTINALSPWFGSKRTLAPRIAVELGPHSFFFDAFCGSLAVTLAKEPSPMEMACDRQGDVTNLARVIQHPTLGAKFYRQCRRILCAQQQFEDVKAACVLRGRLPAPAEPNVERAVEFFAYSWLGRNGVAGSNGGNNFCARYTANGGSPAKRFASAVESIPAWRRRLRNLIVLNEDTFDVLDRLDDARTTAIYADPPYLVKGSKYLHEFEAVDHDRLANSLRKFRHARIVVSYYSHPDVFRLYPGWTVVNCRMTKSMVKGGQRGGGETPVAPEILLINGPSFTATDGGLFE